MIPSRNCFRTLTVWLLTSGCLAVMVCPPTLAGTGTYAEGSYDFSICLRFDATIAELEAVAATFQNASEVLSDATDGQQRFGTIQILNDCADSIQPEYWIHAIAGRAEAASPNGYGVPGEHVNLFFQSNFQSNPSAAGDAYTIAHLHAHHAFGLQDEYVGLLPAVHAECAPTPDTASLSFCLMDNFFERGGPAFSGPLTLNEFCVSGNHDPDGDTLQAQLNGTSCWNHIASHGLRSAVLPAGLPDDTPPPPHTVTFVAPQTDRRIMIVLDRSSSMSKCFGKRNRWSAAKLLIRTLVPRLTRHDMVGLVSFDDHVKLEVPLAPATAAHRDALLSKLSRIEPKKGTNLHDGLTGGLGSLLSRPIRSLNESIFLVSDGGHNEGPAPQQLIPTLQQEGVDVQVFAIFPDTPLWVQQELQDIAFGTGGELFYRRPRTNPDCRAQVHKRKLSDTLRGLQIVASLFGWPTGYYEVALIVIELTPTARSAFSSPVGEFTDFERPVMLEPGLDSALFGLGNTIAGESLSVVSPSGEVFSAVLVAPYMLAVEVPVPEAGVWTARMSLDTSDSGQGEETMELFVVGNHDGTRLNISVTEGNVAFPDPVEIKATLFYEGQKVQGATIEGKVVRPDLSEVPLVLTDDGTGGDALASDAVYGGRFDEYAGDGSYTIELTAVADARASLFPGEALFGQVGHPSNEVPVPEFQRLASTTVVVQAVPGNLAPVADAGEDQLVECSSTTGTSVTFDGTQSWDREGDTLTFLWSSPGIAFDDATSPTPTASLPLGTSRVTLVVDDGTSTSVPDIVLVTVEDTQAPEIETLTANPSVLWPPNHMMIPVTVTADVSDICDPTPHCVITATSSNEPEQGQGDGATSSDWSITGDLSVLLRAERSGRGQGRQYYAEVTCTDGSNNMQSGTAVVDVPHSSQ